MNDLISRQAAIDILDAYQVMVENGEENPYTLARFRMSELPSAQPEQQWVPCSEQMPEEDYWSGKERQFSNNVLVTIVNHAYDDEQVIDIAQTVDGIWKISHDVDGYYRLPSWCEVIAWMPLPPAFKEE